MNHELVIKFWRQPLPDEALMSAITSDLKSALGDSAKLDGHDVKDGEINLFVLTDDPRHSFRRVKKVLESKQIEQGYSAASRVVGGAQFTSIWPLRPMKKFRI
jgi:hypothetical protein